MSALARITLPILSAAYIISGRQAPQTVEVWRTIRQARRLLRASRRAGRGDLPRALSLANQADDIASGLLP